MILDFMTVGLVAAVTMINPGEMLTDSLL